MATIYVENTVVKGHHVYLSEVRTGDIFDCFPEMDNLHDPDALMVINAGNEVGHLPTGFAEHIYRLFLELKDNITVLWLVYTYYDIDLLKTFSYRIFLLTIRFQ